MIQSSCSVVEETTDLKLFIGMVKVLYYSIYGNLTWPKTSEEVKELDNQQIDLLLSGLNPLPQPKVHLAIFLY
ncbi:hypothetical protein [Ligilactobacillus salivarius]|uniref:hypothetical protein n=1 Tax=Ligilactobacillus salivarius TaxID=1624 RepID=UPI0022E001A4|nr:hypothetical protein [Ligilactobacillus salivarius]